MLIEKQMIRTNFSLHRSFQSVSRDNDSIICKLLLSLMVLICESCNGTIGSIFNSKRARSIYITICNYILNTLLSFIVAMVY